ncbi:MAG TPA: LysM peptidoglycan-binding domain-containing protein [Candidatus Dormibacteraeota bacterium]|jgi:LysM repeat protein|nr:LysM peptidoglycan-binding domain-containing protein [Candidatus Dormibacteraeota bacterium]
MQRTSQAVQVGLDCVQIRARVPAPWRLPRRIALVVGLVAVLSLVLAQVAHGASGAGPTEVVVRPGDTLWSIAASHYPNADPRQEIATIQQANHLRGVDVYAGERLTLPGH